MGAPAAALATSTALQATSSFLSGMYAARGADTERQEALYNAQQERYAAIQAYQEGSLNKSMTALAGRRDIASGAAAMSAAGNIGTSAQAAIREGAFNLDKDIAAMDYRYDNEAIQHRNLARAYEYNASIAKRNRNMGIISSFLSPMTDIFGGVVKGYSDGYSFKLK